MSRRLLRDLHAGQSIDLFLVSAVSAVLAIRFYLRLTNYPQVGGETLHIAHMLWGGLLMAVAIVLVLAYLGRRAAQLAAILGGLGFGTFIDEIGKFVTHDNDYFYRPAVALIYVVFVLAYLGVRAIRRGEVSDDESLVNALRELEEAVVHDLDREERERALRHLEQAAPSHPLTRPLAELLERLETLPPRAPRRLTRLRRWLIARYERLAVHPYFARALVAFFVGQLVVKLLVVTLLAETEGGQQSLAARLLFTSVALDRFTVAEWMELGSSLLSGVLVLLGVVVLSRSRLRAYQLFFGSTLVSAVLTQLFTFYRQQWAALLTLAFNLLLIAALRFLMHHERAKAENREPAAGRL